MISLYHVLFDLMIFGLHQVPERRIKTIGAFRPFAFVAHIFHYSRPPNCYRNGVAENYSVHEMSNLPGILFERDFLGITNDS
jgi:hypothetical protein